MATILTNIDNVDLDNIDLWFEYSDLLLDLADAIDIYRRRVGLNSQQKNQLNFYAIQLRGEAVTWATIGGQNLLTSLLPQLNLLKVEIKKIDAFIQDIKNVGDFISAISKSIDVVTNILKLVPSLLG